MKLNQIVYASLVLTLLVLMVVRFEAASAQGSSSQPAIGPSSSSETQPMPDKALRVGTKIVPPFVIRSDDGRLSGISIELWEYIAERNGWQFQYQEHDLKGLLSGVADGSLDVAVAALTVTAQRELNMDFSHPFHTTGLAIAVRADSSPTLLSLLRRLLSMQFLRVIAGLGALLLIIGGLVWFFERRQNSEQFGGSTLRGIGSGFWWSAVTMTTVGYGDKAPKTFVGRLIAVVWMFAAIILISGVTAAITTSLTVGSLEGRVRGPQDLVNVRVGAISGTTGAQYLSDQFIPHRSFESLAQGVAALVNDEIDAFVHDAPLLRYHIQTLASSETQAASLEVVPGTFQRQDYAIALVEGSELIEPLNRALLERISQPIWQQILSRYLGARF